MLWVDPTDPSVFFAVSGLEPDETDLDDEVTLALRAASEILTAATMRQVHPAGTAEEEFVCSPRVRQMRTTYSPLIEVLGVTQQHPTTGEQTPLEGAWSIVQGSIYFFGPRRHNAQPWRSLSDCAPDRGIFRVSYRFGSTISAGARAAVLEYAHELWLARNSENDCALPDRVTSLTREGLTVEMFDPADYLDRGKVGLPRVDSWLASINPTGKARRRASVYTPDRPPGVVGSLTTRVR